MAQNYLPGLWRRNEDYPNHADETAGTTANTARQALHRRAAYVIITQHQLFKIAIGDNG